MCKLIICCLNVIGIDDIVEVFDGVEVLDWFGKGIYDCVMIDWNMFNKFGFEVLKGICEIGLDVLVIMIIIELDKGYVFEVINVGVMDYFKKFFEMDVLREKFDKFVLI